MRKKWFPKGTTLFAGVVNGKNIWRNDYKRTIGIIRELEKYAQDIVISTSCSLLHVPCTLDNETKLSEEYKKHFAFAKEKLGELAQLKEILDSGDVQSSPLYIQNTALHSEKRAGTNDEVRARTAALTEGDLTRLPQFAQREKIQRERFSLPLFPTTTIGSFPQTSDVKSARKAYRTGELSQEDYESFIKDKIAQCVALQEKIGLDVLVHGEYERNDMVEYFGECLDGFLFTEKAWVQSYGTRCVKPPVVWGDISRAKPMTVRWSVYAQSLTDKPMKGMLTGPVTILNWSFPREDISLKESVFQIALAIREEVLDLEANGIKIIQVDEAALREKLPLRRADWKEDYLDWAIPAFRFVHSGVKPETQIHTHMCYSEFADIIKDIDERTDDKSEHGYVWSGKPVKLNWENRQNFKAVHDAAAMYPEQVSFPKLFKLSDGDDGNAVYHTFESMQELAQFYLGGLGWIEQCVEEGFHKKDGFDFTPYEEALNG